MGIKRRNHFSGGSYEIHANHVAGAAQFCRHRNYAAALTGPAFGILFSVGVALTEQRSVGQVLPVGLVAGVFFGVFFGLTMAFFLKGETTRMEATDKNTFVARLNVATSQLGYYPATQSEDFLTYKPSFQAGLAAGRISVQWHEGQAVIVGPKMYVKKLLKRLRSA